MKLELHPIDTCRVGITGVPGVTKLRLWLPEGIMSNTGTSSVYPDGREWTGDSQKLVQDVEVDRILGGGNCPLIDEHTFDCCGYQFPLDSPVRWTSEAKVDGDTVKFSIKLTNVGDKTIVKACAAICLVLEDAEWWNDDCVFVLSDGEVKPLSTFGRDKGRDDIFEAYMVKGESLDHSFYHDFWGISDHQLDTPVMVSENNGLCVGITGDKAYFMLSNRLNPCTDIMLAFGNIQPGETVTSSGEVWVREGKAQDFLK